MPETRIAKLFKNGASQAVRLPAEFRFEGEEVYATRDAATGDVVLSAHPANGWASLLAFIHGAPPADDFMAERPMNVPPADTGVFDDELSAIPTHPKRRR